jgi:hypothetical protein
MIHFVIVRDYWKNKKAAGAAVQAACALRPAPAGSVSYIVVHIKSAMLSDWMVMVMMNEW